MIKKSLTSKKFAQTMPPFDKNIKRLIHGAILFLFLTGSLQAQNCNQLLANAKNLITVAVCNNPDPSQWAGTMTASVQRLAESGCDDAVNQLMNYIQQLQANPKLIDCGNKDICSQLTDFRDNKLFGMYLEAFKQFEKNSIAQTYLDIIVRAKQELQDETRWVTSDMGRAVNVLSQFVSIQCNFLDDLISLAVPVTGTGKRIAGITMESLYKSIKAGASIRDIFHGELYRVALDKIMDNIHPVTKSVKMVKNLVLDIQKIKVNEQEFKVLRKELADAFSKVDMEVKKYNEVISSGSRNFSEIKTLKDIIDGYLAQNCRKS